MGRRRGPPGCAIRRWPARRPGCAAWCWERWLWIRATRRPQSDGCSASWLQTVQAPGPTASKGPTVLCWPPRSARSGPCTSTRAGSLEPADPPWERAAWSVLALGEGILHGAPAGLGQLARRLPETAEAVPAADADLLITRGTLGFYGGRT